MNFLLKSLQMCGQKKRESVPGQFLRARSPLEVMKAAPEFQQDTCSQALDGSQSLRAFSYLQPVRLSVDQTAMTGGYADRPRSSSTPKPKVSSRWAQDSIRLARVGICGVLTMVKPVQKNRTCYVACVFVRVPSSYVSCEQWQMQHSTGTPWLPNACECLGAALNELDCSSMLRC